MATRHQQPQRQPMTKSDVEEWLNNQGYPLEFATTAAFRGAGFRATQGYHVRDSATEKALEVDVIAAHRRTLNDTLLCEFSVVAECKYVSASTPWVVLRSEAPPLAPFVTLATSIANRLGRAALFDLAGARGSNQWAERILFFSETTTKLFSGLEIDNGRDVFFDALQKVTSKAKRLVAEYDDPSDGRATAAAVAFPVVVVRGPLFVASFDAGTRRMVAEEVPEWAQMQWQGSHALDGTVSIDIVRDTALQKYASIARQNADLFLDRFTAAVAELHGMRSDIDGLAKRVLERAQSLPMSIPPLLRSWAGPKLPPL